MKIKQTISVRKLQANRANAGHSTGPKSKKGKAVSRMNAVKHGILSQPRIPAHTSTSVDLMPITSVLNTLGGDVVGEIGYISGSLLRVIAFERDCAQDPDLLERNARLICRYDRMLTQQLHQRVREWADLTRQKV